MADFANRTTEDLEEEYDHANEHLGEVETQYASEVALYGDAWVGANDELARIQRHVEALRTELNARYAAAEAPAPDPFAPHCAHCNREADLSDAGLCAHCQGEIDYHMAVEKGDIPF